MENHIFCPEYGGIYVCPTIYKQICVLFPSSIMNTGWINAWNIAIKEKNEDLDSPIIVGALCTPENFFGHGEKIGFWRGGGGEILEF